MTALQSKLYQAAKQDRERRFHALYDKLCLGYVLRCAWEAVRRNQGAAGLDHQTIEAVEEQGVDEFLAAIQESLQQKTYRPTPVRRVEIPKGDGKTRPLGIPTVRDRVVQAAAKLVLEPIFEADFEGTPSFGFRPETGAREAMDHVREHSRRGFRWVVDADIERFFDTLDHQQLMAALRQRISDGEMLRLIYRWLKAGYVADTTYHDSDQGSPQGSVISPLLSNVYLHRFDQAAKAERSFLGKLTRYADDFVIQCGTREQAEQALAWARRSLEGLGVRLHPEKTRVVEDREGFDFLGFHHQRVRCAWGPRTGKESHGVLRWPGKKARARFRARVRAIIGPPGYVQDHWSASLEELERYLKGWGQYFRCGESQEVFRKLDRWVLERLARSRARATRYGKGHRRRSWVQCLTVLRQWGRVPELVALTRRELGTYRGRANARWRAV
jgi:RNA-directed DNA polymerase